MRRFFALILSSLTACILATISYVLAYPTLNDHGIHLAAGAAASLLLNVTLSFGIPIFLSTAALTILLEKVGSTSLPMTVAVGGGRGVAFAAIPATSSLFSDNLNTFFWVAGVAIGAVCGLIYWLIAHSGSSKAPVT